MPSIMSSMRCCKRERPASETTFPSFTHPCSCRCAHSVLLMQLTGPTKASCLHSSQKVAQQPKTPNENARAPASNLPLDRIAVRAMRCIPKAKRHRARNRKNQVSMILWLVLSHAANAVEVRHHGPPCENIVLHASLKSHDHEHISASYWGKMRSAISGVCK